MLVSRNPLPLVHLFASEFLATRACVSEPFINFIDRVDIIFRRVCSASHSRKTWFRVVFLSFAVFRATSIKRSSADNVMFFIRVQCTHESRVTFSSHAIMPNGGGRFQAWPVGLTFDRVSGVTPGEVE